MPKGKEMPSQEYLKECFEYNEFTGILTWKQRPREHYSSDTNFIGSNKRFLNKIAGTPKGKMGYLSVKVHDNSYAVHRIIWKLVTGNEPSYEIDHINNIRDDNRWCNLREASSSENGRNRLMRSDNTSGVKGVCWDKESGKWLAQIWYNNKNMKVGRHETIEAAEEAIRTKRIELYTDYHNHGEKFSLYANKARHNLPS
jgi:hypothetical protein